MRACWCLEKAELGKELAPADLPPKKLGKAGALLPALVTGSSDAEAAAHSARCIQECGEEGARLMQPIESLPEQPPALGQGGFGGFKVQMAAVAKSFPEQEEIGVNSRLCN